MFSTSSVIAIAITPSEKASRRPFSIIGREPSRRADGLARALWDHAPMATAKRIRDAAADRAAELAMPDQPAAPRLRVAVLTCMDVRIDPLAMLGLQRGDAHVIRNAGALVTDDAVRSLSASQRMLGTEKIVVVMHEQCGLLGASDEDFAAALAADGAAPEWRLGAFADLDRALRDGLERLRSAPELPAREHVHGFVFDPRDGTLREVRPPT
jgi:carbonic anhydrase